MGNFIVLAILTALFGLAVFKIFKNKGGCKCSCSSCPKRCANKS